MHDRLLIIPRIAKLLFKGEEKFTLLENPFNTINKLHILITKGQTEEKCEWCIEWIIHHVASKLVHLDEVAGRQMKGADGKKGLIEELCLTLEVWKKLTTEVMHTNGWASSHVETVRKVLDNAEADAHQQTLPDLMWQQPWPESLIRFYEILEDIPPHQDEPRIHVCTLRRMCTNLLSLM